MNNLTNPEELLISGKKKPGDRRMIHVPVQKVAMGQESPGPGLVSTWTGPSADSANEKMVHGQCCCARDALPVVSTSYSVHFIVKIMDPRSSTGSMLTSTLKLA